MSGKNSKKQVEGMWLTWLAILLIVVGMLQEFLWMFFDGNTLMWTGAGCVVAGIACMAYLGKKTSHK
ncbi:MAG: hypothetical protein Q4P66_07370 [Actinomycetaceae bacterium]|nr:hypothetical protein [Actinomycetaceae bacterium]